MQGNDEKVAREASKIRKCGKCGVPISNEAQVLSLRRFWPRRKLVVCPQCASAIESQYNEEAKEPHLLRAFLYGLAVVWAAAIFYAVIIVITVRHLTFLAIGVGWAVARGVMLGAGHKRGLAVQVLSALLTIFGIALIEVLAAFGVTYTNFGDIWTVQQMLARVPRLLWHIDLATMREAPIIPAIWALAILVAYCVPAKRHVRLRRG
jgi:hypothetical protein